MRYGLMILSAAIMLLPSFAAKANTSRDFTSLWDQYKETVAKNRPADGLKILEKIKTLSLSDKSLTDYYKACLLYRDTRSQINWKDYHAANEAFVKEIRDLDEPVVTYAARKNIPGMGPGDGHFADSNRVRLEAGHNPGIFEDDNNCNYLNCPLPETWLLNDYECVLWSEALETWNLEKAKEYFAGRYPMDALLEYNAILHTCYIKDKAKALNAFAKKHKGNFVSMFARGEILNMMFQHFNESKASSEKYLILRDQCKTFIKDKETFSGQEGKILREYRGPEYILSELEGKRLDISVKDNIARVLFTNCSDARLSISNAEKEIWASDISDEKRSFHIPDTVYVTLPDINDGEYTIVCRDKSDNENHADYIYGKYSLSVRYKHDADGQWVMVMDSKTGEPMPGYENGFKALENPDAKEYRASFVEGDKLRLSPIIRTLPKPSVPTYKNALHGEIFIDRCAFNPDETVNFTTVCFYAKETFQSLAAGIPLTAKLLDTRGKVIESKQIETDKWGQGDGSFKLKRKDRNGSYMIGIYNGKECVCSKHMTVDDFNLPNFDILFDKDGKKYLSGDTVHFSGVIRSYSGHPLRDAKIRYSIGKMFENKAVSAGELKLDANNRFSLAAVSPEEGSYDFICNITVTDLTGETLTFNHRAFVRNRKMPVRHNDEPEYWFKKLEGDDIALNIGSRLGPTWVVTEVYGEDLKLKESVITRLDEDCIEKTLHFPFKEEYDEVVKLYSFFFKDGMAHENVLTYERPLKPSDKLSLEFGHFTDKALPCSSCMVTIKTKPGTVCTAAVFNASSENIRENEWHNVKTRFSGYFGINRANSLFLRGRVGGYGKTKNGMMVRGMMTASDIYLTDRNDSVKEEAIPFQTVQKDVSARKDFAQTLAWEPQLVSDENGEIKFSFKTADNLSTFVVQIFAHDKKMRNAVIRKEMIVTMPVTVNLVEPQFLFEGDKYIAMAGLSNSSDADVSGTASINGVQQHVTIPAYGSIRYSVETDVPQGGYEMTLNAAFIADNAADGSDAVQVAVPVLPARQTLTEAHSALLLSGQDKAALVDSLRAKFINIPGNEASMREIPILEMVREAIPQTFAPRGKDVLSLSEALCGYMLAESLGASVPADKKDELIQGILACRNADGGFAWFAGGESSMIITAVMLQRFKLCGNIFAKQKEDAVRYLDKEYFTARKRPIWCGGISMQQYLLVRSMYNDIRCTEKIDAKWLKEAKKYLIPKTDRGGGWIFFTARRALTLSYLMENKEYASKKIRRSLEDDVESLSQYAVKHPDGGMFFPNAVMPWRGLMESELDAHNLLCYLMDRHGHKDIAEGVRLWMMIQKETQQWHNDPAYVLALKNVLEGTPETLETKVIALTGSFDKPMGEVKAAGNGMEVSRRWFKMEGQTEIPLKDGDPLTVGDRIISKCTVSNAENRSFVVLSIPRYGAMRPVRQLSGYCWCGCYAYRNVLQERTEYWMESFAEGKNEIKEEYFVTQQGLFHAPAISIECRYAPHYRANSDAEKPVRIQAD